MNLITKGGGEHMSLEFKTFTCKKCGKRFTKAVGGIVASPKQLELEWNPVCDQCKWNKVKDILGLKK